MEQKQDIVLYQIDNANVCVSVFYKDETFWLTRMSMAELFGVGPQAISKHLGNIYKEDELDRESTSSKMELVQNEGGVEKFRQWATKTLKEYITKGFVLNDDMLKNGKPFGKDYFDELLERIREIRASERRAYQKITDVFEQCSYDYDKNSEITRAFYAFVQNKLHFAVTGQTAAELIYDRADAEKPTMGLTTWKDAPDGKILKRDIIVAKNYLNEKEMSRLNRLVTMFIDYAELMAEDEVLMSMQDWVDQTNRFLSNNRRKVLEGKGRISHEQAVEKAAKEYDIFRVRQDQEYISEFDKQTEKYFKGE